MTTYTMIRNAYGSELLISLPVGDRVWNWSVQFKGLECALTGRFNRAVVFTVLLFDAKQEAWGEEVEYKLYEDEFLDPPTCLRLSPPHAVFLHSKSHIDIRLKEIVNHDGIRNGMKLKADDVILDIINPSNQEIRVNKGECHHYLEFLKTRRMLAQNS